MPLDKEENQEPRGKKNKIDLARWKLIINGSQKFVGILVGPVILGGILGYWLDKKFNSAPWLFTAAVFAGFIISIAMLLRKINK